MEIFKKLWLQYDPDGTGMISVNDYFNLVINLPPPLRLTEDQLLKKLGKYLFEYKGLLGFTKKTPRRGTSWRTKTAIWSLLWSSSTNSSACITSQYTWKTESRPKSFRVVHFRDVASLLSKVAVENKFPLSGDIKYESKLLETAIMDLWLARYPSKISSLGLADMKEKYIAQTIATLGRRFAGYDTRTYLAVMTSQRVYRSNKKNKNSTPITKHRVTDRMKELADDINNNKLKICAVLNTENFDKLLFEDIITKFKERKETSRTQASRFHHKSSHTVSYARVPFKREHKKSNATLTNLELDDYMTHYQDVFNSQSKRRKSIKQPPQRMGTIDHNKWATALFSNVNSAESSKNPKLSVLLKILKTLIWNWKAWLTTEATRHRRRAAKSQTSLRTK